ncbi:MAG: hypothetical protein OWU32_05375 [Firmicutes bacterium]|nr:hypothetical protein [Bacillota bacterium]
MIIHWGLLLLGLVQATTAITVLMSVKKPSMWGIATLPESLSIYRYMLTALWLSVASLYVMGAFDVAFYAGATWLAIINVGLEIVGYWKGRLPGWYQWLGTVVMGGLGLWCLISVL